MKDYMDGAVTRVRAERERCANREEDFVTHPEQLMLTWPQGAERMNAEPESREAE